MWLYNNVELTEIPDNMVGFVYCITNLITGKQYIGKKNFFSTRRVKVKNRTNKKKIKKISDFGTYFGSSNLLLADVQTLGSDNFKREILHLCKSKGWMSYLETKEQIEREVLLKPDNYYNNFIGCRIHGNHLK